MKKNSAFQLRSGNKPSPAELSGVSPMKNDNKFDDLTKITKEKDLLHREYDTETEKKKKAAKALGGSLTKIAEKIKKKKKKKTSPTLPKPGDDAFQYL